MNNRSFFRLFLVVHIGVNKEVIDNTVDYDVYSLCSYMWGEAFHPPESNQFLSFLCLYKARETAKLESLATHRHKRPADEIQPFQRPQIAARRQWLNKLNVGNLAPI